MDPQATLNALVTALSSHPVDESVVVDSCDALATWLEKGGSVPIVDRNALFVLLDALYATFGN